MDRKSTISLQHSLILALIHHFVYRSYLFLCSCVKIIIAYNLININTLYKAIIMFWFMDKGSNAKLTGLSIVSK